MGSRTNFHFKQGDNFITLYSHWGGESKLKDLAHAISKAEGRWQDESYCIRIIISQLIGVDWESETGFGLYANDRGGEESYQSTIIDCKKQLVIVDGEPHTFMKFIEYQWEKVS